MSLESGKMWTFRNVYVKKKLFYVHVMFEPCCSFSANLKLFECVLRAGPTCSSSELFVFDTKNITLCKISFQSQGIKMTRFPFGHQTTQVEKKAEMNSLNLFADF